MADTIRGPVTNVVDGNTFDMKITHTGKDNQTKYNNKERIRIADIDEPELNTPAERDPKKNLKGNSKEKKCVVMFRRVIPTRESLQK